MTEDSRKRHNGCKGYAKWKRAHLEKFLEETTNYSISNDRLNSRYVMYRLKNRNDEEGIP